MLFSKKSAAPRRAIVGAKVVVFALALAAALVGGLLHAAPPAENPAIHPAPRLDRDWWMPRHEQLNALAAAGDINLLVLGDSLRQGV